jgi:serpin B
VTRDTSPSVAATDEASLVSGNTGFALALYGQLSSETTGANLFYSPYSVSLALAMTYVGAAANTASQMASALDFSLPVATLGPAFDQLDLAIEQQPTAATGADGQAFSLNLADAMWGDQSLSFNQPFITAAAQNFGARLRTVDFAGNPTVAEAAINQWVTLQTNGKIDPLLGPGAITTDTVLVLVNAVYFNAGWATQFNPSATKQGTFTRADGSTVRTSMMYSGAAATTYSHGSSWQAVELPYSGGTTSMVVVLPNDGAFAAVEQGLTGSFYTSVTAALAAPGGGIDLTMPGFKIHGPTVSLKPALQALGMTDAFDASLANFTAMSALKPLYIFDVVHQAYLNVDGSGTEAAAATGVITGTLTIELPPPPPPVTVTLDHPFFFFIRDIATNTVLFVGREGDPTAD